MSDARVVADENISSFQSFMDYLLKGLNDNRDYLGIDSAKEAVLVQLSHNT